MFGYGIFGTADGFHSISFGVSQNHDVRFLDNRSLIQQVGDKFFYVTWKFLHLPGHHNKQIVFYYCLCEYAIDRYNRKGISGSFFCTVHHKPNQIQSVSKIIDFLEQLQNEQKHLFLDSSGKYTRELQYVEDYTPSTVVPDVSLFSEMLNFPVNFPEYGKDVQAYLTGTLSDGNQPLENSLYDVVENELFYDYAGVFVPKSHIVFPRHWHHVNPISYGKALAERKKQQKEEQLRRLEEKKRQEEEKKNEMLRMQEENEALQKKLADLQQKNSDLEVQRTQLENENHKKEQKLFTLQQEHQEAIKELQRIEDLINSDVTLKNEYDRVTSTGSLSNSVVEVNNTFVSNSIESMKGIENTSPIQSYNGESFDALQNIPKRKEESPVLPAGHSIQNTMSHGSHTLNVSKPADMKSVSPKSAIQVLSKSVNSLSHQTDTSVQLDEKSHQHNDSHKSNKNNQSMSSVKKFFNTIKQKVCEVDNNTLPLVGAVLVISVAIIAASITWLGGQNNAQGGQTHAKDGQTHAKDGQTHAKDGQTHAKDGQTTNAQDVLSCPKNTNFQCGVYTLTKDDMQHIGPDQSLFNQSLKLTKQIHEKRGLVANPDKVRAALNWANGYCDQKGTKLEELLQTGKEIYYPICLQTTDGCKEDKKIHDAIQKYYDPKNGCKDQ